MSLEKITIHGAEYLKDKDSNIDILHVHSSHSLIQAAGYLKFTHAGGEKSEGIYFRGQRKLYKTLEPSLFRGITQKNTKESRTRKLSSTLEKFRTDCRIFSKFGDYAHEPLLQHYGISTTWIDVVDNVWVALWFACHQAKTTVDAKYQHFERRVALRDDDYAYILLIGSSISGRNKEKPGYFYGASTELVDLRMAAPSIFLRPHAQHGLLFRMKGKGSERPTDYACQIRGVIRVTLRDALAWLGEGKAVGTHSLFPPAFYDSGYKILLDSKIEPEIEIGKILHIGT